jgi:DegV family protein with EDD domain
MPSIAVITDTDASLPVEVADRFGIRQVPIIVQFGEQALKTTEEIEEAEMFARIDREGKLPTTSAPAPGQFSEAYEAAFSAGAEAIVCICVSSEVSATYNAAVLASEMFAGREITVLDSHTLSMAQGFMVLAAAEAAQAEAPLEEIVARATDVGQRTHLYAALATLKYLAMSGRVGHLAAGMASVLNIRPILTIRDGKLDMLERVRTQGKSWARAIELTGEALGGRPAERMAIIQSAVPDQAREFEKQLRASLPCPDEILIAPLTAGLSVHSGAGMLGVVTVSA